MKVLCITIQASTIPETDPHGQPSDLALRRIPLDIRASQGCALCRALVHFKPSKYGLYSTLDYVCHAS